MNDKKVLDERWKSRYNEEESSRCLHKIKIRINVRFLLASHSKMRYSNFRKTF